MKSVFILLTLTLCIATSHAQSIQRSVIGSGGQSNAGSNLKLRYTVGEAVINTVSNAGQKIKQGFQQGPTPNLALPVQGFEFFARRENANSVELRWKTMSEQNNQGFYIERKLEHETTFLERSFQPAIMPQASNNIERTYSFWDANSFQGISYYRIRQIDHDGKSNISLIRTVSGDPSNQAALQVWPIPSSGFVNIRLVSTKLTEVQLLDSKGATLQTFTMGLQGDQRIDGLKPGIYFIAVKGEKTLCEKIVVN